MSDRDKNKSRKEALIALLDDPSPVVRKGLEEEFERLMEDGILLLKEVIQKGDGAEIEAAESILNKLEGPDTAMEFVQFIRSLEYELETGMLMLDRVVRPDIEVEEISQTLDAIAMRCREIEVLPSTPRSLCQVINRVLFHEHGFRGNIEDYEDPENSFLSSVLKRKKGIPISLCITYLLVADRLNLQLEPIALPGHFLVGCFHEELPFYIDPFERGRIRSVEEVQAMIVSTREEDDFHFLAPVALAEVLCRVCRNLTHHFNLRGDARRSRQFARFVVEFEEVYRRHSET